MAFTPRQYRGSVVTLLAAVLGGCGSDSPTGTQPFTGTPLSVIGHGQTTARYTAELWTRGNIAYTSTWSQRGPNVGNAVHIWDVAGNTPVLVDSLIVELATTLGDIQVSDDDKLLVIATERANGSIVIYDLTNPLKPTRITRFQTANTANGVHTAEVARVNGTLYGFLSIDPPIGGGGSARLVIVDLSDPRNPQEILSRNMGNPFVHDVFVRDGLLFTALWNDGVTIWDIGGGAKGGTPANPVQIGNVRTAAWSAAVGGSEAHNVWWFQDAAGGANAKRFMFIGEEAPGNGSLLNSSNGDIHVVDVSDMAAPREVAFYHVDGAGTHNFSVDEQRGILYAAYYNAGVRALDVRGDLSTCTADQKSSDGRCDLRKMGRELAAGLGNGPFIWGVHFDGNFVYASDMLTGIWKLAAASRPTS
jgi:hypothetical protein